MAPRQILLEILLGISGKQFPLGSVRDFAHLLGVSVSLRANALQPLRSKGLRACLTEIFGNIIFFGGVSGFFAKGLSRPARRALTGDFLPGVGC